MVYYVNKRVNFAVHIIDLFNTENLCIYSLSAADILYFVPVIFRTGYEYVTLKKALPFHYVVVCYDSVHIRHSEYNEASWPKRLFLVARLQ